MDRHLAFPNFPELATKRLRLREISAADLDWYLDHFSTLEIVEGQGYPAPVDREGAAAELHRYVLDLFASRMTFDALGRALVSCRSAWRFDRRLLGAAFV